MEDKKPDSGTRLSYSSSTTLSNCQMKYFHYKVAGTKKDPDCRDDFTAFNVGKAFHQILENTMHQKSTVEMIEEVCVFYKVEEHQAMIHAMVLKYLKVHKKSGLDCVGCEMELLNDIFIGFVDAVMKDDKGGWWIVDLKTAAMVSPLTFAKLGTDTQLNLYASFAPQIAEYYGLDLNKFKGARYRVTKKSRLKRKASEEYNDFVRRVFAGIESYDAIIPLKVMDPDKAYRKHKALHTMSMAYRGNEYTPMPNYSYCDSFFRPCEYFSQCHGQTYTEAVKNIEVVTVGE